MVSNKWYQPGADPVGDIQSLIERFSSNYFNKFPLAAYKMLQEPWSVMKTPSESEIALMNASTALAASSRWELVDGVPKLDQDAGSLTRIVLTSQGYLGCSACKAISCGHVLDILANYRSDAELMTQLEGVSLGVSKVGYRMRLSDEDGDGLGVKFVPDEFTKYERDKEGVLRGEVNMVVPAYGLAEPIKIGTISIGEEGFGTIHLLVNNWLDGEILPGKPKCNNSMHYKVSSVNELTSNRDVYSWIEHNKCYGCLLRSRSIDDSELIPESANTFPRTKKR